MRTSSSSAREAVGTRTQLLFRALLSCVLLQVDGRSGCARLYVFARCPDVRGEVLECLECCAWRRVRASARGDLPAWGPMLYQHHPIHRKCGADKLISARYRGRLRGHSSNVDCDSHARRTLQARARGKGQERGDKGCDRERAGRIVHNTGTAHDLDSAGRALVAQRHEQPSEHQDDAGGQREVLSDCDTRRTTARWERHERCLPALLVVRLVDASHEAAARRRNLSRAPL